MPHSEIAKKRISLAKIGNQCALGHKLSEEAKERIRNKKKGQKHTYASKCKISIVNKGRKVSDETRRKLSASRFGIIITEEHKDRLRKLRIGKKADDIVKEKMSKSMKAAWTVERKQQNSVRVKLLWKDPKYASKVMSRRKMTGPEKVFNVLIEDYNWPYNFVGNGLVLIGNRNPDFIHKTKNKVIEIFGEFFHAKEDEYRKIDDYKNLGYDCLVIWASKLKDRIFIFNLVNNFNNKEGQNS